MNDYCLKIRAEIHHQSKMKSLLGKIISKCSEVVCFPFVTRCLNFSRKYAQSKTAVRGGAPWSCGHIRLLEAPRVGRSNPRGIKKKKKKTAVRVVNDYLKED